MCGALFHVACYTALLNSYSDRVRRTTFLLGVALALTGQAQGRVLLNARSGRVQVFGSLNNVRHRRNCDIRLIDLLLVLDNGRHRLVGRVRRDRLVITAIRLLLTRLIRYNGRLVRIILAEGVLEDNIQRNLDRRPTVTCRRVRRRMYITYNVVFRGAICRLNGDLRFHDYQLVSFQLVAISFDRCHGRQDVEVLVNGVGRSARDDVASSAHEHVCRATRHLLIKQVSRRPRVNGRVLSLLTLMRQRSTVCLV